jgi:hypothetical protein
MLSRVTKVRRRAPMAGALLIAVLVAGVTSGLALAQQPPTTNQGPRFGQWGPGQPPPAPELPQVQMAPPAMPAPAMPPPPTPNNWGGCNYNLSGYWAITGHQNAPYYRAYTSGATISQYGNWLRIDQPDGGYTYYGQCNGNSIELDVYQGGQFVGYENGVIDWSGGAWERWRSPRIRAWWQSFVPLSASGQETWHRAFLGR